jgi:hypothetical protein
VRKIALSKLVLGPQTYRADPGAPDFGATWISPDVRQPYRAVFEHRVLGLSDRVLNAFAAAGRPNFKPLSHVLQWGESYYLIGRENKPLTFPSAIATHALATIEGWRGALIALPDLPDPEIAAWLETACDLPVARAKRQWAFVYPPLSSIDDDGTLQVASASKILLAIKPIDERPGDADRVSCTTGTSSAETSINGHNLHILEITIPEQEARKPIYLRWADTYLATVMAQSNFDQVRAPEITLAFSPESPLLRLPLHHANCLKLLEQVRQGQRKISEISGPSHLTGQLCWRRTATFAWQPQQITFPLAKPGALNGCGTAGPESVTRINALLQDQENEIKLDFGTYGAFHSRALALATRVPEKTRLDRELRARIEWLCKAAGTFAANQRRHLADLDDGALLETFARISVPNSLLGHRRALEHQLRRIAGA